MYKGGLYLAIGDSTTYTNVTNGEDLYASKLWRAINSDYGSIRHLNKGVSGNDSSEMVNNLPWLITGKVDLVTIGVGMNDANLNVVSVSSYTDNLKLMIDRLRYFNKDVKIILCSPNRSNDTNRSTLQQYRDAMSNVATLKSVGLVKFEDAFTDGQISTYTVDGIHPTSAGHQLLFNMLYPIVQSNASTWLNKLGK